MSPNSVADAVLGNKFGGAQVLAVNGETLPGSGATDDIQAQMAFRKELQDHVGDAVKLTLQLKDGSKQEVELPAANLKLPGVHFSVGPVKAVVRGGELLKQRASKSVTSWLQSTVSVIWTHSRCLKSWAM